MRQALMVSAGVHLALVTALLVVVHSGRTVTLPGSDVVEVSLVGAMPEQAPAPAPAPEAVAPSEEQGVRIEKAPRERPKPTPPAPQPRPQVTRPTPTPATPATPNRTTLPIAAMGGGMRGSLAVDGDFEFAYYLQSIRARIAANWTPPAGLPSGTHVDVYFRIARDGSLSAPRVETASGSGYFDQTALRAVLVTGRLAPLPAGYRGDDLGVHFGFEYAGP